MTPRDRVLSILQTDPSDVGCGEAFELLDAYVELAAAGQDPEQRLPGVRAHLTACGPCNADYEGLLASLEITPGPGRPG